MDANEKVSLTAEQEAEFDRAFELLTTFVDLSHADQMLPLGPAAVYTASVVLWLLVYQRLKKNATLEVAVKQLIESAPQLCRDNKRIREKTLSGKTGSYSDARQRLPIEVAEWFANHLSDSIVATAPPSLGDRRAFLIDGTTTTLAPEKELRAAFPPAQNQHGEGVWPVALLLVAHELESGCAMLPEIGPMYGPNAISEVKLVGNCFRRLPPGSIVIGDINFGIFSVVWEAVQAGQVPLCRLSKSRFATVCRQGQLECQGENWKTWKVRWRPTTKDRQSNPDLPVDAVMDVLVHEIVVNPELTLRLVTLLSESAPLLAGLYGKRWEVESDIRNVKVVLDTESIRARSEEMFRKELLTSLAAYNLVVQMRRQAARLAKVPVKNLSFTGVWTTFRQFLLTHLHQDPATWRERFEFTLRYAMRDKLPNRPGRKFERTVYPRRPKGSTFKKRTPPPNGPPPGSTK
jgi:hypothetical protein